MTRISFSSLSCSPARSFPDKAAFALTLCLALGMTGLTALPAQAACTVEYKAKKDDPLRLDQGTVTLPSCTSAGAVESAVRATLAARGWTLLKIVRTSEN